ncbi:hypothetical protein [Qingshengfaniella alkalisoli]|uniref:DUF4345 domain-containing protein n=1 Tax=Qingshengfaniella alkalisoli TaxID=2599296 RepID=A0A5B8IAN8_9RHOB|nr:hypothetical protein [Qingshengfaniella alkalisoli]QDY71595.1 hypothetical protein FPZ52_18150 [Qingshengfaniella alkalisoli]
MYSSYRALGWLRFLVGLGFVLNLLFFLPGLFAPRYLENLRDFGITNTIHWLQNVGLLLAIITAMYIPVIRDPFRYIFITYLVVAGRFAAGSLFVLGYLFMDYPDGMLLLGGLDLLLSTIQAVVLRQALYDGDPRAEW